MKFVLLIFCLFLVTYIPRMLPALFMDKMKLSSRFSLFLQLIPYTAMTSLIFPSILHVDKNMSIGIVAGIVAIVASLKKLPLVGVVLCSVLSCLVLYVLNIT